LLRQAVLSAGAFALPALAAESAALGNGDILPGPDFSLLKEPAPYLVGVRPHRRGGVRLELEEAPLQTPSGNKYLIHNYGHGGGGITLSFGCATVAAELVERALARLRLDAANPRVAVLGTGAIGLTAAAEIRRRWPALPLAVYARDLDVRSTTSFVAPAQFMPSGILHEHEDGGRRQRALATYLARSRDRIVELQRSGRWHLHGIAERKDYTLDRPGQMDALEPSGGAVPYRRGRLPFQRLDVMGREYSTWLVNPTILLPRLVKDLRATGVRFARRQFDSLKDVAALVENVLVNCTGYGARRLFGDGDLVPLRGHLVVLEKTRERQDYFYSGGCENQVMSYVFCRQDDIVVGGTLQRGNETRAPTAEDAPVFRRMLANARALFDGHPEACVP